MVLTAITLAISSGVFPTSRIKPSNFTDCEKETEEINNNSDKYNTLSYCVPILLEIYEETNNLVNMDKISYQCKDNKEKINELIKKVIKF